MCLNTYIMAVHFVPPKFNYEMAMKQVHRSSFDCLFFLLFFIKFILFFCFNICLTASIPLVQNNVYAFYSRIYMLCGTTFLIYTLYHIMADCVLYTCTSLSNLPFFRKFYSFKFHLLYFMISFVLTDIKCAKLNHSKRLTMHNR